MPYCTIEEAWSQTNLLDNTYNDKNYVGFDPNIEDGKNVYYKDYLYNDQGEKINLGKNISNDSRKIPQLSRSYNRRPEHSGTNNRLTNNSKRYVISNGNKILDGSENHPRYSNEDLPINNHDNLKYQELSHTNNINNQSGENINYSTTNQPQGNINYSTTNQPRENINYSTTTNQPLENINYSTTNQPQGNINYTTTNQPNINMDISTSGNNSDNSLETYMNTSNNQNLKKLKDEIELLKMENAKLKLMMDTKNSSIKDDMGDIFIFILTGIFIIIMMENLTKLFKKF